jgi:hypothetical protein
MYAAALQENNLKPSLYSFMLENKIKIAAQTFIHVLEELNK